MASGRCRCSGLQGDPPDVVLGEEVGGGGDAGDDSGEVVHCFLVVVDGPEQVLEVGGWGLEGGELGGELVHGEGLGVAGGLVGAHGGVRPAPPPAAPSPAQQLGLTPREQEVLALVADGRTNRQIAQTLFISDKTASVHVSRILAKLGVANRAEAGAVAHRLHLTG